ncbi:helix-turn-helix transcriptional regulator (plasmid) [Clavibacter tessellarius]|jgi:DNA-binding transcriptional ArsR family regulator|nr:helix-turn-helix transcriptional regulator [Clavibacter michiganensis subsp. tessellarius]
MTDRSDPSAPVELPTDRQNGHMPARRVVPEMSARVTAIHHAISSAGRLTALRHVLENPGTTRTELVQATGLAPLTARDALTALEEHGYITADVQGERVGKKVHYTANRPAIAEDASAFLGWLLR